MSQIYLSYSRKDTDAAKKLMLQINDLGYTTGIDRQEPEATPISHQEELDKLQKKWIKDSELLLFLVSSKSIGSETVWREVSIARKKESKTRLLAVILEKGADLAKIRKYARAHVLYHSEGTEFEQELHEALIKSIGAPATVKMELDGQDAAWLIANQGRKFDITKSECIIGRGPNADVDLAALDDQKYVSREHATLSFREGVWILVANEDASNDTLVNGEVVSPGSPQPLKPDDEIVLGAIALRFVPK